MSSNCKALQLLSTSNPEVHLAIDTHWDASVKALSTSSSVRVDLLGPGDGFFAKNTHVLRGFTTGGKRKGKMSDRRGTKATRTPW